MIVGNSENIDDGLSNQNTSIHKSCQRYETGETESEKVCERWCNENIYGSMKENTKKIACYAKMWWCCCLWDRCWFTYKAIIMARKKNKLIDQASKRFSEDDVLVSKNKAKQILDIMYDMELDARDLWYVIYRIQEYICNDMLAEIIESMKKENLIDLIQQIAVEAINCEVAPNHDEVWSYNDQADIARFFHEFAEQKTFSAGDMVEVQIMRIWKRNHPSYWEIEVTADTLAEVKYNFDTNKRWIDLAVDENHEDNHKALWWFRELSIVDDGLFAKIELTKMGADLLTQGAYKYFSPEIIMKKVDEETWEVVTNLLVGGAFTNRPFFKLMDAIMANESGVSNQQQRNDGNYIYLYKDTKTMNKFMEVIAKLANKDQLTKAEFSEAEQAFNNMTDAEKTSKVVAMFGRLSEKFNEEVAEEAQEEVAAESSDETVADEAAETEEWSDEAAETDEAEEAQEEASDEAAETIAASEKSVVVKASEYETLKAMSKEHAKLVQEAKVVKMTESVDKLCFSETNNKGKILPKNKKAIVDFAASLSEQAAKKFFEILESFDVIDPAKFNEQGSGKSEKFSSKEEALTAKTAEYVKSGMKYSEAFRKASKDLNIESFDTDEKSDTVQ